ncbi:MAG: TlpA disulfide reductase family protein [Pedobacter sp.]|uniref:redoxin domain-containing protein n=1 Tax=Pedobacter sp. TaxID=1411316 RepID=UPI003391933A
MTNYNKVTGMLLFQLFLCVGVLNGITGFKSEGFIIEGSIVAPEGTGIQMTYQYLGKTISDSARVKDNKVILKGVLPQAVLCTLSNSVNQQIKIIVAQNERIRLSGSVKGFYSIKVDGGSENDLFSVFKQKSLNITADYRAQLSATKETIYNKSSAAYIRFHRRVDSLTRAFVGKYPDAVASSLAIINSHMNSTDVLKAEDCYNLLSERGKKNQYAGRIKMFVDTDKAMKVGNSAPELVLKDLNARVFKLSAQRGKYVLLDFWASWCIPCREEHPLLRKLYHDFKNDGIVFVSVSMDTNDKNWRNAIEKDQLVWRQLNDPSAMGGMLAASYGIKALPFNCIIDPEGKILATKLRGQDLENFLVRLLKKDN